MAALIPPNTPPTSQFETIDVTWISRLFRFVNWANYLMLYACGFALLTLVTRTIWTASSLSVAIGMLLMSVILGISAWVGWKNIGILGAVVHKYTYPVMVLLAVFSGFLAYVLWRRVNTTDDEARAAIVWTMISLASLFGVFALLILHRLSIPTLNLKLRDFLLGNLPQDRKSRSLKPTNRTKGLMYVALGLLWMIGMVYLPVDQLPEWLRTGIQPNLSYLSAIGFVMLIYARHYLRPDFKTVHESDTREPIIFLRSFQDDEKMTLNSPLFDFSLESRLADQFSAVGPFIAVGKPGDESPHLGAARAKLSNEEWQSTVTQWMAESRLIIVMIGHTHWVDWELKRILEQSQTEKLIILFPETRHRLFWRRRADANKRLAVIRGAFADTAWSPALANIRKPQHIRGMIFLRQGRLVTVTSLARNRDSYHLAALMLNDLLLKARGVASPVRQEISQRNTLARWLVGTIAIVIVGLSVYLGTIGGLGPPAQIKVEPLPADTPSTVSGKLVVGGLHYLGDFGAKKRAVRTQTFYPGETVELSYLVSGFGRDSAGRADVSHDAEFVASNGSRAHLVHSRFFQEVRPNSWLQMGFTVKLSEQAALGDYRFNIKLQDALTGSEFQFKPPLRIEKAPN